MKHESGYQAEPPTAVRLTRGRRGRPGPQGKRSRCSPGVGDLGAVGGTGEIFAHVKKGGGSPGGRGGGRGRARGKGGNAEFTMEHTDIMGLGVGGREEGAFWTTKR